MSFRFSLKSFFVVAVSVTIVGVLIGFIVQSMSDGNKQVQKISPGFLAGKPLFVAVDNPDYVLPGRLTSSAKVKAVLRKNHRVVKLVTEKRFKGDTIFIGYLIPEGYGDRDQCVKRKFGISVGDYVLSEREFSRLVGKFDSGSRYGNVRIEYVRERCDPSRALSSAKADLEIFLADEILRLMPGIPPGP